MCYSMVWAVLVKQLEYLSVFGVFSVTRNHKFFKQSYIKKCKIYDQKITFQLMSSCVSRFELCGTSHVRAPKQLFIGTNLFLYAFSLLFCLSVNLWVKSLVETGKIRLKDQPPQEKQNNQIFVHINSIYIFLGCDKQTEVAKKNSIFIQIN